MADIFYNGVWSLGFDFLANGTPTVGGVLDYVYGTVSVNSSYARFSGKGILCTGAGPSLVGKNFGANLPTAIAGFGYLIAALPAGSNLTPICTAYDNLGGQPIATLAVNSVGEIQWYSAGGLTPAGSSSTAPSSPVGSPSTATLIAGSYAFIEILVTVNSSSGSLIARINGATATTFSGNTQKTNPYWNLLLLGTAGTGAQNVQYDDWYMLDTTGASPLNTFIGNSRIQTDVPTGESATGGLNAWAFTTPQGTDYGNCANIPPNSAQYNSSNTVGQRMSLSFPAIASAIQCFFLNTWFSVEEDSAGTRTVSIIYRSSGVDQVAPALTLPGSFTMYNQPSTIDPATGVGWSTESISAPGACEIGLTVAS